MRKWIDLIVEFQRKPDLGLMAKFTDGPAGGDHFDRRPTDGSGNLPPKEPETPKGGDDPRWPGKRRHLILVQNTGHKTHPWGVFIHGFYFNGCRTEEEAEKIADEKEAEWDREYENSNPKARTRICQAGHDWYVLERGVIVGGPYSDVEPAKVKAEEINPNSPYAHML